MPRLYSYVVTRDYGFAPNPFFGVCTLATCKPKIRSGARVGDWIEGTTSARGLTERRFVFAMCVEEVLTYERYWTHPDYQCKKPHMFGSRKYAFGDNIYHRQQGGWKELNSHHSYADGAPNIGNVKRDTQTDRVLIGREYCYWGGSGPRVPAEFTDWDGCSIQAGRGHKSRFPKTLVNRVVGWFREEVRERGYLGEPADW